MKTTLAALAALMLVAGPACAQVSASNDASASSQASSQPCGPGYGPCQGAGPGAGRGYGPGAGYGPGPGAGYGPGMMRGYGPGNGYGPRNGYGPGYGRGMMGGYGGGMMGGYGGGMMGGIGFATLRDFADAGIELTPEQQAKVRDIQRDARAGQWKLMESMHELRWQGDTLYRDGKLDANAARKRYESMESLRKAMFESRLQAATKLDAVLTQEQRERLAALDR